uniref:Nanos-type domain-containing protein n=1 Tax=Glossina morsitans morsitans TaxID=37546 RepID=A0ABK9NG14_GLOMM
MCILCGFSAHNTLSKTCPTRKRGEKTNKIKIIKNISFKDFRERYSKNFYESLNSNEYDGNLPALPSSSSAENVRDIQQDFKRNGIIKTNVKSKIPQPTVPAVQKRLPIPSPRSSG